MKNIELQRVQTFLDKMIKVTMGILNIRLELNPRILLLNEIKDNILYRPEGKMLLILLSAVRTMIVQYWKENKLPP